jgi:hypothetical protein
METPMTETQMQDTLINILLDSDAFPAHAIDSFEDAGIMTRNRGVVVSVKADDGRFAQFQITIVKSR